MDDRNSIVDAFVKGLYNPTLIFYASVGTEHVAHPIGQARILVVEMAGSV